MNFREEIKRWVRRAGYDVKKYDALHPLARRMLLLDHYGINLLFDVGANIGQYASLMRHYGYRGRIVSFEPLSGAFRQLQAHASGDPRWEVVNTALGHHQGAATINVAEDPACSSLLAATPHLLATSRDAAFVTTEEITVETLDAVFDSYYRPGEKAYLKIDAQGYERRILEGSNGSLHHILGVQMELSLVPLYEGETLLADMIDYMSDKGYTLMSIEPVHAATTGQLLQVDGIFFRTDA